MSDSIHETAASSGMLALHVNGTWDAVFQGPAREALEAELPRFVLPRRWFGSKTRTIRDIRLIETIPILPAAYLTLLDVTYAEGTPETYVLPMAYLAGDAGQALSQERPAAVIAALNVGGEPGILYDALWDPGFCAALLDMIREGRQYPGASGDLVATASAVLPRLLGPVTPGPESAESLATVLLGVEQSNTSVRYGQRLIMKLYRRLEVGINPDQEIGQFLTSQATYANTPPLAGVLEFRRRDTDQGEPITIALLQGFVPNRGDAWRYSLDALADYFVAAHQSGATAEEDLTLPQATLLDLIRYDIPARAEALIGSYLASARLLGRRTAELHLALTSQPNDRVFAPEPFTPDFQTYLHRSMRELTGRILHALRTRFALLPPASQAEARQVLTLEDTIAARFDTLLAHPIHALRARIHGDFHLGQVLYTGDDFMLIDFEGEPARPLSERRMKRSPLQDVAGMLRSFHYAAYAAYFAQDQEGAPEPNLEPWARYWHLWVSVAYLKTYMEVADGPAFLPASHDDLKLLLDAYLVEKAVYELGYELNNRPAWVKIPLQGILQTVQAG